MPALKHIRVVEDWKVVADPLAKTFMQQDLRRSGLTPDDLHVQPVEHVNFPNVPAYVIHYGDTGYWRVRLKLEPDLEKRFGKYRGPRKEAGPLQAYIPRRLTPSAIKRSNVKYICEGEKKAEKLFKDLEVMCIGISGCWSWSMRNAENQQVLLPSIQELIKPEDVVYYVADRDILNPMKLAIGKAAKALQMKLAAINASCKVLVPPDPHKGADDWLVAEGEHDLDALEEFLFNWFPVAALIDAGVTFKPNKDGEILSVKQAISDERNTKLLTRLVLRGDPFVSKDKFLGYTVEGQSMGMRRAALNAEMMVNEHFPGFVPRKEAVVEALDSIVDEMPKTNIIASYIQSLTWDGKKRLDNWLPRVMRLKNNEHESFAHKFGLALVCGFYSRLMNPGSKCDFMFILHGPQGIGKTTFFETLAKFPGHNGYTCMRASQVDRMDYTLGKSIQKATVLDIDDMESVRGKMHGDIKSFISRTHDEWREPYISYNTVEPRGCIITGSTNSSALLTDLTGSRRFLILSVTDIRGVRGFESWSANYRDQLLAECHARWADLEKVWWNIGIEEVNRHNRDYAVSSPLVEAIMQMRERNLLLEYNKRLYITANAIQLFMDDPMWSSSTKIGMWLRHLRDAEGMPLSINEAEQLRFTETYWNRAGKDICAYYKPRGNSNYPIRMFPVIFYE